MSKIAGIYWDDTAAAPGISLSVYFSGCHFHCPGCHNPEAQDFEYGEDFTMETAYDICYKLNKNNVMRKLSILGGEPLTDENLLAVSQLCDICKYEYPDLQIYIWTGYLYEEILERATPKTLEGRLLINILSKIDYLIDGRFELDKRDITLPLRGSSNQRIIHIEHEEREEQ